jgi:hypothetical protein
MKSYGTYSSINKDDKIKEYGMCGRCTTDATREIHKIIFGEKDTNWRTLALIGIRY